MRVRRVLAGLVLLLTLAYALRPAGALVSLGVLALAQLCLFASITKGRRTRRMLVVTLSATVALGIGEIIALQLWPIAPHRILPHSDSSQTTPYLPDEELGTIMPPHFRGYFMHPEYERELFETNSDGFRGAEWPAPMPLDRPRILLLGDSTAVGFGVERSQTISALLQAELETTGAEALVFNASVAGYGPRHERILLERLLDRVQPTHVLTIFYDGNDLQNCRAQFVATRRQGLHSVRLPSEGEGPDILPLASRPPSLLSRWYWAHRSALYLRVETALMPWLTSSGIFKHHAYGGILRVTGREPDLAVTEELELALEAVLGMSERCEQLGIEFLLVRMPMRIQTEIGSFEDLVELYEADPEQQDRTLPGSALLGSCRDRGVHGLDLLPLLEIPGKGPNPHYFVEGHPNQRGNRLAARQIAKSLRQQGLTAPTPIPGSK